MNIISCKGCGVVLDANVLPFYDGGHLFADDGTVRSDRAAWDGDNYAPVAPCPCCSARINKEGETL